MSHLHVGPMLFRLHARYIGDDIKNEYSRKKLMFLGRDSKKMFVIFQNVMMVEARCPLTFQSPNPSSSNKKRPKGS